MPDGKRLKHVNIVCVRSIHVWVEEEKKGLKRIGQGDKKWGS